jgi:hypothetical protein
MARRRIRQRDVRAVGSDDSKRYFLALDEVMVILVRSLLKHSGTSFEPTLSKSYVVTAPQCPDDGLAEARLPGSPSLDPRHFGPDS